MSPDLRPPLRLALASAGLGCALGLGALAWGVRADLPMAWGIGLACLLQVGPSLAVANRLREGLGNRGLDGERRTLRATAHLTRLLALVLAIAAVLAWNGGPSAPVDPLALVLAVGVLVAWAGLWLAKRAWSQAHPSLLQDAGRTRTLVELAGLLVLGVSLGSVQAWVAHAVALGMALVLFRMGQAVARETRLSLSACGGCGGGCG